MRESEFDSSKERARKSEGEIESTIDLFTQSTSERPPVSETSRECLIFH